jgi:hypothetical protein
MKLSLMQAGQAGRQAAAAAAPAARYIWLHNRPVMTLKAHLEAVLPNGSIDGIELLVVLCQLSHLRLGRRGMH